MKLMIVLASFLVSSMALAMPTVSDYAKYDLIVVKTGLQQAGTLEQEITAYNAASDTYSVKLTLSVAGQTQSQVQETPASKLLSTEQVEQTLASCAQLESVTTPAGTFQTCAVPATAFEGTANIGQVAFGLVKFDVNAGGAQVSGLLTQQSLGQ